jgi:hypothetical protein
MHAEAAQTIWRLWKRIRGCNKTSVLAERFHVDGPTIDRVKSMRYLPFTVFNK